MQEFVLSPPAAVLYLVAAVLVVGVASVFLKKMPTARRAVALGVLALVAVLLVVVFYRPTVIVVDAQGISVRSISPVSIGWAEAESAVFEPNLRFSPFRPTVRTGGIALGDFRSGRFLLSNGSAARVFMEQSNTAVVVRTAALTYLFAPADAEGLARAVAEYRILMEEP